MLMMISCSSNPGAILWYLAEREQEELVPKSPKASTLPSMVNVSDVWCRTDDGNLNVFRRYFSEKIPAVIRRYHNESSRLFAVLDDTSSTKNTCLKNIVSQISPCGLGCTPIVGERP